MRSKSAFEHNGWSYDGDQSIGTGGSYSKNGWRVFCDGDGWTLLNPETGRKYARHYAACGPAIKNADRIIRTRKTA